MKVLRLVVLGSLVSTVAFAQTDVQVTGKKGTVGVKTGTGGVEVTGKSGKKITIGGTGSGVAVESGDKKVEVGGSAVDVKSGDKSGSVQVTGAGPTPGTNASGTFEIDGQGRTLTHACQPNEDVDINGQGHNITLTGPCRNVEVNGQGNTVNAEKLDSLDVNGMSNKATWKSANTGPKPRVSVSGLKNSAVQAK